MREKVSMVVVLVGLSALSAIMLAFIDHISSDMIESNRERGVKLAVLSVLSVPLEGREGEEVFDESIEKIDTDAGRLYLVRSEDGKYDSAAFRVVGTGFWGPIHIIMAVNIKDLAIRGIEVLDQDETPGLGARIEEAGFRERFRGKLLSLPIVVRGKGEKIETNDVAAITGATISSKAVERIVNEASRSYIDAMRSLKND